MHYTVRGSGPPIVFLHGIPTSGRLWDYVVEDLEDRFTCVTLDFPGTGESPLLPEDSLDSDSLAAKVDALREELELPSWHVVAHDAGSTIAVHYATTFADRVDRLGLLSPPVFPDFKRIPTFWISQAPVIGDLLAPLTVFVMWNGVIQIGLDTARPGMNEILEAFRRPFRGLKGSRRFLKVVRWGDIKTILSRSEALLPQIKAPTLVIQGRRDSAVPQSMGERAAERIPDGRLVLIDHGHFLSLSAPEEVAAALGPFLAAED